MTVKVFVLQSAKVDLQDLRNYLSKKFGKTTWRESYANIRETRAAIEKLPESGRRPDEFVEL